MSIFKDIHVGNIIKKRLNELEIDEERIKKFFNLPTEKITEMLSAKSLDSEVLLKWSKLLKYDFFRVYSQHLILYAPEKVTTSSSKTEALPVFRKNIYTREVIDFIIEKVNSKQMTKQEVIEVYGIPKTTLYKWFVKYNNKH